ncbi:Kelch repeat-containing protein [Gemmatimonadota bacterium]
MQSPGDATERGGICLLVGLLLALTLSITGCEEPFAPGETGSAAVSMQIPAEMVATIGRIVLTVTGSDMDPIEQDLTIEGNEAKGTIETIPAGLDRLFTVDVYNASEVRTHTGSVTSLILPGMTVELEITLSPVTGDAIVTVILPGWAAGPPLSPPRSKASAAVIEGILYLAGGLNQAGGEVNYLVVYDPASQAYLPAGALRFARVEAAAGAIDGKLYVAGGSSSAGHHDYLEVYDPVSSTSAGLAPMSEAKSRIAGCVADGKFYVMGGQSPTVNYLSTLEVYDPASDSWSVLSPMPTSRRGLACVVVEGKIHALGGLNSSGALGVHEIYDPATDTWSTAPSIPSGHYLFTAALLDGRIYAIGGMDGSSPSSLADTDVVSVYSITDGIWGTTFPLPDPRHGMAAGDIVINGKIYVAGGYIAAGGGDIDLLILTP